MEKCALLHDLAIRISEGDADALNKMHTAGRHYYDLGCLMNMAGKLKREDSRVQVRHVAEVLAGMTDGPAIGEGKR